MLIPFAKKDNEKCSIDSDCCTGVCAIDGICVQENAIFQIGATSPTCSKSSECATGRCDFMNYAVQTQSGKVIFKDEGNHCVRKDCVTEIKDCKILENGILLFPEFCNDCCNGYGCLNTPFAQYCTCNIK